MPLTDKIVAHYPLGHWPAAHKQPRLPRSLPFTIDKQAISRKPPDDWLIITSLYALLPLKRKANFGQQVNNKLHQKISLPFPLTVITSKGVPVFFYSACFVGLFSAQIHSSISFNNRLHHSGNIHKYKIQVIISSPELIVSTTR